jgi:hypothetical protein
MGVTGSDVQLSEKARALFPWAVECKSHARYAIYGDYQQACDNAGNLIPLLVIKGNNMPPLVVMSLEDFFASKQNNKNPDRGHAG